MTPSCHPVTDVTSPCRRFSPLEGHDLWAATYDETPNPVLALEERTLGPLLPDLKGKLVLDLACGTGRWFETLLCRGATRVVGLDFSSPMLARAAAKPGTRGRLVQADCLAVPIRSGAADLAICSFLLAYLPSLPAFADELRQVLRPGSDVFLADLHPSAYGRGWRRSFRRGSVVIEMFSTCHPIEQVCWVFSGRRFELLHLLEPGFGEPERQIFRSCGKTQMLDVVCGVPAIWVAQFRRT